jgi:hypothetical protein
MANTILTSDVITKEAIRILHEMLVFTNKINKQYDGSFARKGAKIGDSLRIRKPAQFVTRIGKTYAAQPFTEQSLTLTINKQLGLDVDFSDEDLALSLNDFSEQFIRPAMSQLATSVEAETLNMILLASNSVYNTSGINYKDTLTARKQLFESLTPSGKWCAIINPATSVNLVDELKGLFQDSNSIAKQYQEGLLGRTAGFDFYESNIMPNIKNPSDIVATVTVAEAGSTATFAGLGASEIIPAGFRFNVAGSYKVHAETKKAYADLYEFVALAPFTTTSAGVGVATIRPTYSAASGALQNVSALPAGGSAIVVKGAANEVMRTSIAFAKDAFTMATADLVVPNGTDMASRQVMDGISLRFVRDFDASGDGVFVNRFDIIFGYTPLREQFASLLLEPNV